MIGNFVVADVQVSDGVIFDQSGHKHAEEVVINKVPAKYHSDKGVCLIKYLRKGGCIGYFHAKQHSLVIHADLLHTVNDV